MQACVIGGSPFAAFFAGQSPPRSNHHDEFDVAVLEADSRLSDPGAAVRRRLRRLLRSGLHTFTATITPGAWSNFGVALAANHAWTFTTGDSVAPELPVNLGMASSFAILAKTGISTVPTSAITGNIGVSPAAATYITGFSLTADSTNVFSTSPQVVGKVFAADYAPPTPSKITTAVGDMELALTDAAGRAADVTELGAGNIGGLVLAPGVNKWGTGLLIPTQVTLSGSATDVWIFQIAQDLTIASATNILLAGGALAKNVLWQVSGHVELGTSAHLEGIVLCQTAIALHTGASLTGRLLAQTAVTIDGSAIVEPSLKTDPATVTHFVRLREARHGTA